MKKKKEDYYVQWKKSAHENVRITLGEYRGRPQISIRIWYLNQDGELCPGAAGINLGIDHLAKLFDGIRKVKKKAMKRERILSE